MKAMLKLLVFGIALIASSCSVHQEMIEMPVYQPDLSLIDDGIYPGSYKDHRWFCNVEVEIKSHQYDTIIVLCSANGTRSLNEKLVTGVLENQTIELDGLSGATITSNTFFKAVENSLESALEK